MEEEEGGASKVDRSTRLPTLARTFVRVGGHHRESLFTSPASFPTDDEVALYVWEDTTLREVMHQIQRLTESARGRRARASIAVIFPGKDRRLSMKRIGMVHSLRSIPSDDTTLHAMGYRPGDFLDISILV